MNLTVLLIEQNSALERDLERLMAIEHCNVIGTAERWLGLYFARHHQPNVIVSTIDLPQLDRYERCDLSNDTTRLDRQAVCVASRADDESRQFAAQLRERVGCVTASGSIIMEKIATESLFPSVAIETELKQPA